jgi:hypothetical protein
MVLIRKDDKLILHGGIPVNYKWVGLIFVWLGSMIVGLGLWKTGSGWPLWLVLAVPFLLIGGFLLLRHQTVTTIFDLPSRRVIFTISSSVGRGWHQRSYSYSYSFAEIAGIGVRGSGWGEDGVSVFYCDEAPGWSGLLAPEWRSGFAQEVAEVRLLEICGAAGGDLRRDRSAEARSRRQFYRQIPRRAPPPRPALGRHLIDQAPDRP